MYQTPEAEAFLKRITSLPTGPGISLDEVLQPSLDDEAELRKLFATDKTNARLDDPLVGLVDIFDAPDSIRTTRARVAQDDKDLSAKYVMPLSEVNRRKEGAPSVVHDIEEFKKNWAIFTEGSLSQLLDWNNVVAAGGAVLACLNPLSDATKESKRSIRKYYHSAAYPTSDVDLFLWGMDAEQAEKKIIAIYEAVRDSVPWDVTCVRTKHTVSIHSQYPYRSVQIVLRLYRSPAEILAGFDIDAPSCLYDGDRVLANPRAIVAMMRQANTVDMTRRSPSYEVRLAKYSARAFEVYVPTLERDNIDPTIYERSITRIEGLARLLVLEKLADTDVRHNFLESRRSLRGRPNPLHRYFRRKNKYKGDLKADTSIGGLEMNDYDVATLHIPYGPGWDARRIDKLVYQTDLGMNSTFNPKNKRRRLHRHPAFFGTMIECLDDCCEHCPVPIDSDEKDLQAEEDKQYIRGRIAFMEEDPGRQSMSGSFNPIDVGEWSSQVYIGETEHFFAAIAANDREGVANMIKKEVEINRRDHVGRTSLHVAILTKASEIACDLIEAGARITARLVDGRSPLHLAAQLGQPIVIRKLLEKSALNMEAAGEEISEGKDDMIVDALTVERPSSEDDWTSGDGGVIAMDTDMDGDEADGEADDEGNINDGNDDDDDDDDDDDETSPKNLKKNETTKAEDATNEAPDFLEDAPDLPDILEINLPDWDFGFTPLCHAIVSGSLTAVEELLKGGADPALSGKYHDIAFHPLLLTIINDDEEESSKIFERLVLAGASSSTADDQLRTIFHRAVISGSLKLVSTILRCDPNANTVINFPCFNWSAVIFPIVNAIGHCQYSMLATLLAHGAKLKFVEEDVTRALENSPQKKRQNFFSHGGINTLQHAFLPIETAIANHDDVAMLLAAVGADCNVGISQSMHEYTEAKNRKSIIDWVQYALSSLSETITKLNKIKDPLSPGPNGPTSTGWKQYLIDLQRENNRLLKEMQANSSNNDPEEHLRKLEDIRSYLIDLERVLVGLEAKSWNAIYPEKPCATDTPAEPQIQTSESDTDTTLTSYALINKNHYRNEFLPQFLNSSYDKLFEACFTGDNETVQQLCLPQEETGTTPLNIFTQAADRTSPSWRYKQSGYTPLFAAVQGRRWTTAKLIMAIAVAQYRPDDREEKFIAKGIGRQDEDFGGENEDTEDSDNSDDGSDGTVEQEDIKFIDVAKMPSAIEVDVHPRRLLDQANIPWWTKGIDGKYTQLSGSMMLKAVHDNDFETFVNVANLYKLSPIPIDIPESILEVITQKDLPDMLDEYIRRTGLGINVNVTESDQEVSAVNDKNKMYLGLTVHGKKRKDLAKMNDPNATHTVITYPLVWRACLVNAHRIIEYLAGDRPLTAYRYYASTAGDELAHKIRRTPNLEKVLPEWLGWTKTELGDSPLTAAILGGGDLDLIKKLFNKKPKLMSSSLHETIKFIGYNSLTLAIDKSCPPAVIDYLLAKSVSPAENDPIRGWNIYHILCQNNNCDLLEHLLQKLPRDVNEALLIQQSKRRFNTPLHLAVKCGAVQAIKLILNFTTSTLLLRDIDGSTPLHCAVQRGLGEITETMLQIAPIEALYMENGVGETLLEMATLQHTLKRATEIIDEHNHNPNTLSHSYVAEDPRRIKVEQLEMQLPKLRSKIEELIEDGRLIKNSKLTNELLNFSATMESKLVAEKAAQGARAPTSNASNKDPLEHGNQQRRMLLTLGVLAQENKNPVEHENRKRTLEAVSKAVASTPGKRQLVRLVDVQRSVQGNLARYLEDKKKVVQYDDGEGLKNEDDPESKERESSLVLGRTHIYPDGN